MILVTVLPYSLQTVLAMLSSLTSQILMLVSKLTEEGGGGGGGVADVFYNMKMLP